MWPISIKEHFVPIPFRQQTVCDKFINRSPELAFPISMAHQYQRVLRLHSSKIMSKYGLNKRTYTLLAPVCLISKEADCHNTEN